MIVNNQNFFYGSHALNEAASIEKLSDGITNNIQPEKLNITEMFQQNNLNQASLSTAERALVFAIKRVNESVMGLNVELDYSVHDKTKSVMIKLIDKETNEIVREIPPEKLLDAFVFRMELVGLYVDEKG